MRHVDLITESRLRDIARDNFIDPDEPDMSDQLTDLGLPDSTGLWEYYAADSFSLPESDYYKVGEIEESEEFARMIDQLINAVYCETAPNDDLSTNTTNHIRTAIRLAHTLYRIDKLEIEDQLNDQRILLQ